MKKVSNQLQSATVLRSLSPRTFNPVHARRPAAPMGHRPVADSGDGGQPHSQKVNAPIAISPEASSIICTPSLMKCRVRLEALKGLR
ncbi:hypothetical protein FKM82_007781 [Ascaphus truei]